MIPNLIFSCLKAGFLKLWIASAIFLSQILSINKAALLDISWTEEELDAITGQPDFIASITGIPNPSYDEGYINANEFW